MTFFDILSYLFYKNKPKNLDLVEEDIQQFTPFMVARWLSFYDRVQCVFVNETLNKFTTIEDNKASTFKFYYELIPKLKFKKINYNKKIKEGKDDSDKQQDILILAKNHNISSREVRLYMDFL
jgi:hypothetical protein